MKLVSQYHKMTLTLLFILSGKKKVPCDLCQVIINPRLSFIHWKVILHM